MSSISTVRRALAAAAIATAAVLAGCAEPPAPAPPPPPPVPDVSLSPKVIEQAAAYRRYVTTASAIPTAFTDGTAVAQGLQTAAAYEPAQLLRGAIAYGAVVALQDPTYVAGVRTFAANPETRRQVAYEIMKDPAYVVGIDGSAGAAGLVINALGEDGHKLFGHGKLVKQAAYDVQRQAWSKKEVAGRDARLLLTKQLSSTPLTGDVAETARLQQAVVGASPMSIAAQTASPPYSPLVIRSMAVAALAALGHADDASVAQVMPLLAEPASATCLSHSKLNLYQCLAVAKPHYEDVFCLGQHTLMDTGRCVVKAAGLQDPQPPVFIKLSTEPKPKPKAPAPKKTSAPAKKK